jgi:phosphoethanolamine N-methyltransferase
MNNDDDVKKIIKEYPENYCLFLEATYGTSMLSDGGEHAIERLLNKENLHNKKLLDIGFGLGGVDFYLAEKYGAQVFGVEINPWMVEEAYRRTPAHLQDKVSFYEYHPDNALPFQDNFFDVIFSKGVLMHLNNKANLFNEVNRVLKPQGTFVNDDWLSPAKGQWGSRFKKMCESEDLTLYAETVDNYIKLLEQAHFSDIEIRDENKNAYQYNLDIVARLKQEKARNTSNPAFNEISIDEAINNYQLIADSIKDNELLVRWIRGIKGNK